MSLLSLYHCHLVLPVPCPVPQGHSCLCVQPLWLPLCGAMDQPDPGAVATKGGRWWLASKLSPECRDLGAEVPETQDRVLHRKGPGRGQDRPIPPAALGEGRPRQRGRGRQGEYGTAPWAGPHRTDSGTAWGSGQSLLRCLFRGVTRASGRRTCAPGLWKRKTQDGRRVAGNGLCGGPARTERAKEAPGSWPADRSPAWGSL